MHHTSGIALVMEDSESAPESGEFRRDGQSTSDDAVESGRISHVRLSAPASVHGLFRREDFVMLGDGARNRYAPWIERLSARISSRVGLLHEGNQARFDAFNSIVAYVYPRASVGAGVACSLWCNWLFFFDDVLDEDFGACSNPERVRAQMEHHLALLSGAAAVGTPEPLERLTLEFRARALELAGVAWLSRFCATVRDYLFCGVLPAAENWRLARTPSFAEYVTQREHDSAVLTTLDLIEIANGIELSEADLAHPDVALARSACARTIGFFNDIVSYPKEVIRHQNPNNLVHVLMQERGMSNHEALLCAIDLTNEAADDLARAESRVLARLPAGPHPLKTYFSAMSAWQRGNIDYSLEGERYASRWSPVAELLRPDALR
jgi:hypothetical protein